MFKMSALLRRNIIALVVALLANLAFSMAWYPYGTNTPYQPGNLKAINTPVGCTVVHLDMVLRHGSRYPCSHYKEPLANVVEEVNKVHKSKAFTFKNLTIPWKLPDEYQFAGDCEQGEPGNKEIYQLGKRFRSKYNTLFNKKKYWNAHYRFEASDTPRSYKSAVAFSMGLFDGNGTLDGGKYQPIAVKVTGPKTKDKKLRFFSSCARYIQEINNGPGLDEWKKFAKGFEIKQVISNVNKRLNLGGKIPLDADFVYYMFWFCAYATMNNLKRDWCALFDEEDLNVMDYYDDLWGYYSSSYGNEIGYKTNCPLMSDIVDSLDNFISNKDGHPYGTFRFTHISTILALQTLFGMYNSTVPLRADNYAQNANRTFRTSKIVPMSASLALVVYRCGKDYKVQALMNENSALLPCCCPDGNSSRPCSLEKFMSCYKHIGKSCNFEALCAVSTGSHLCQCEWMILLFILVRFII